MVKKSELSSDFSQNTSIHGSQQEIAVHLFGNFFCGIEVAYWKKIEFVYFSRYSQFYSEIKPDGQNTTPWTMFSWFLEKLPLLSWKLELDPQFLLKGISKTITCNNVIILPSDALIPLYINLDKKLELRAKREFVFPRELVFFFSLWTIKWA